MNNETGNSRASRVPEGVFAFLLLSLLSVACSSATAPLLTTWEGTLEPVLPHTLGGRGAAVTQYGHTTASIQIEEGDPETTYGWRINAGTCQEAGEIQGGAATYPPMVSSPGGSGTAGATLSESFRSGDAYAMRVYLSAGGGGEEIVACGELTQIR